MNGGEQDWGVGGFQEEGMNPGEAEEIAWEYAGSDEFGGGSGEDWYDSDSVEWEGPSDWDDEDGGEDAGGFDAEWWDG